LLTEKLHPEPFATQGNITIVISGLLPAAFTSWMYLEESLSPISEQPKSSKYQPLAAL
jgi:hypothetical protein